MDYCGCDYDQPSVFSSVTVKAARKPHRCGECGSPIKAGETYRRVWGIWNGDPGSYLACSGCSEMAEWAMISVPCFCYAFGELHEAVRDMVGEVSHDVPGFFYEYGRRVIALRRRGSTYFAKRRKRSPNPPDLAIIKA